MRKDYTVKTHRISLAAMFAAMTLIVLYLAAILPSGRLSLYFLSSIFIAGLLVEDEPVTAAHDVCRGVGAGASQSFPTC